MQAVGDTGPARPRPGATDDVIDSFPKALEDARRVGGAGVTLYAHNLAESPVRGSVDRSTWCRTAGQRRTFISSWRGSGE